MAENRSTSSRILGQLPPESPVTFDQNQRSTWSGILSGDVQRYVRSSFKRPCLTGAVVRGSIGNGNSYKNDQKLALVLHHPVSCTQFSIAGLYHESLPVFATLSPDRIDRPVVPRETTFGSS